MEKTKLFRSISDAIEEYKKEDPIPFVWNGIKEGSFGYVFGPSKSGKTIFCENLALSLGSNQQEFLGHELLQKDHRVLFISMEEFSRQRTERNIKQIEWLKEKTDNQINLQVVTDDFPRFFAKEEDWETLERTVIKSEANIVFIDSFTRLSVGKIEESSYTRNVSIKLRELTDRIGVTMVVVHHTPKHSGKFLTIDSLAGSRVLAQESDFMFGINRGLNGDRYFKEVAFRYKRENDEKVMKFEITDDLWISPIGDYYEEGLIKFPDRRTDDTNLQIVMKLIKEEAERDSDRSFKSNTIEKKAKEWMDRSTFYLKLDQLIADGIITKISKGKYLYTPSNCT